MTGGITPIDNGLELIGLHQCSALMRFIFVETMAGKAVFALGLVMSLIRSLGTSNLREVVIFGAIFFSILILIILPVSSAEIRVSVMEEGGYSQIKTQDILAKAGISQMIVSPVLDVISRVLSSSATGAVSVLDRFQAHGAAFLKDPWITVKFWLLMRERLSQGIIDPLLKEKVIAFYQDYYFPALRELTAGNSVGSGQTLWPGSSEVVAVYSTDGAAAWRALQDDLYASFNNDALVDKVSQQYYSGASLKESTVRALIAGDISRSPRAYAFLSYSSKEKSEGVILPSDRRRLTENIIHGILAGMPWIYGLCLWSLWVSFPFVLVLLFLSANSSMMVLFLKAAFALKMLPVLWALSDRASELMFDVNITLGEGKVLLWDMPLVGMSAIIGIVGSWIIMAAGLWWLSKSKRVKGAT
ncbi:MAG: hypothetical protein HQL22_06580 [Candidatus Omnitrophica bacterium]|nr:hypothetical protein [Candidatus Omnitrophota bacterium]